MTKKDTIWSFLKKILEKLNSIEIITIKFTKDLNYLLCKKSANNNCVLPVLCIHLASYLKAEPFINLKLLYSLVLRLLVMAVEEQ